jgi:hypothetical protein
MSAPRPPQAVAPAAKGSRIWLWVLGVLGVLVLGCCTCGGVAQMIEQQNREWPGR